jgi:hypothetical protein
MDQQCMSRYHKWTIRLILQEATNSLRGGLGYVPCSARPTPSGKALPVSEDPTMSGAARSARQGRHGINRVLVAVVLVTASLAGCGSPEEGPTPNVDRGDLPPPLPGPTAASPQTAQPPGDPPGAGGPGGPVGPSPPPDPGGPIGPSPQTAVPEGTTSQPEGSPSDVAPTTTEPQGRRGAGSSTTQPVPTT